MVAVVALASSVPVSVPAALVRLNAMTASTSQAALAVKIPEGRCAMAEAFRSASTCSITAWPRWVVSAVMVFNTSGSAVVKKAWNRHASKRPSCPAAAFFAALKSGIGIRRTTNRLGTWSDLSCDENAMKSTSATSAFEIHYCFESSSKPVV